MHLPVLRLDWETLAWLAYRWSKPLDLDACPVSSLSSCRFYGAQTKKPSRWFCGPHHQTVATGFVAQIGKPERVILRPNHKNRSHQFWCQTWRSRWLWFWGWTKKPALILSLCMVQITHSITRPLDSSAIEYLTCAWPSSVLCTKSHTLSSILIIAHHAALVTYASWDNQTCFSTLNR
jgi:hypothetical protein